MAFKAILTIDDKSFNVMACHYAFHQNIDPTGRPSSDVRGGTVSISIESSDDDTIYTWMTDAHSFRTGKITFYKRDQDSKMKELEFKQAACIDYAESFDANSSNAMMTSFTISAQELSLGGNAHTNAWPE
jgi:hypothetical protein